MPLSQVFPARHDSSRPALPLLEVCGCPTAQSVRIRAWKPAAPLRLWHLTSLDAPTVAVIWALGFSWVARTSAPGWMLLLLALVTWAFYVADRLLDARAPNRGPLRARHLFHWRHRRLLIPLTIVSAAAAAAMIFALMPVSLRQHDSLLGAAALAYFSGVHSRRSKPSWLRPLVSKELLVGVIFTAGCCLPVLSRLSIGRDALLTWLPLLACIAFFAALAWFNCRAIEYWESGRRDRGLRLAGSILAAVGMVLAFALSYYQARAAALTAAGTASAFLILLLDARRDRLAPVTLRAAADLVLLTPLFLLVR